MNIRGPVQESKANFPLFNDGKFHRFLNCGHLAVMYLTKDGYLQYITPLISSITGFTAEDCGKSIHSLSFSLQNPNFLDSINTFIFHLHEVEISGSNDSWDRLNEFYIELELTGNNQVIYQAVIRPCVLQDRIIDGIILVFYDITSRKSIENMIEKEKEKYRLIAELMDSALWEYDIAEKSLKQYRKLKGKYQDELLTIKDFRNTALSSGWIYPEDFPVFEAYCDSMDRGDELINYDLRALSDNGEYIWLRYQGAALKTSEGNAGIIMGRTINIDREYKDHEKLVQKTERDALTGLYNRASTKEKAEQCFNRCNLESPDEINSFMIIDIDDFKQANDQWGHLFGDVLLETFSKLVENLFDSTDIVGRIGGDEFVVIQKNVLNQDQIINTAKALCELARRQMNLTRSNTEITISVGVASYPKDGRDYETLYQKADIALYAAKSLGKDRYAIYDSSMDAERHTGEENKNFIAADLFEKNSPYIEKRLLNFAFDIGNEAPDLSYAIRHILQEIGKFYDLSRITIFENSKRSSEYAILYDWANSGMIPIRDYPSKQTKPILKIYDEKNHKNGVFYFNDLNSIRLPEIVMQFFKNVGTKALVQCAIFDGSKYFGILTFEDCIVARKWTRTELDTLFTLTKLIGRYLIQLKNSQELEREMFFSQATLDTQKLSNYAVQEGTYKLVYFSEYTKTLYPGAKLGELCHKALFQADKPCDDCPLKGLDEEHKTFSVDSYYEKEDAWYTTTASSLCMPDNTRVNLICSSDVTNFIWRVSSKDSLTGLLTLTRFEVEAYKLLNAAESKYLIIYNDFDKFKNIDDEWGYATGNELLILYADTVGQLVKPTELFCRISADKFIMMLAYRSKSEVMKRINISYNMLEAAFREKYPKINAVITSGIYYLKPEDKNISVAIDKANLARKTIKGIHKSDYAVYDEAMHRQITKEKRIAGKMHNALRNEEFVVYMQPKVDLSNGRIYGAEALVRWKLPTGKIISPMEFIPVFEKNGFIDELDFYVYNKTLKALRTWLDMGKQEIIVSLNVSRIHLKDPHFVDRLYSMLVKYGIPCRLIELEITESMFFVELDRIRNVITTLRNLGFLISIDDFGSGYSSLNMLKTLPVDILKLDREFFLKNDMRSHDKIIISGIISLAKGLGLKVISEGVETEEQLSFLKESSCDMAQGYYFYKPMPMEEFLQLLQ